ncbi:protein tantalus [Copidosoma floridanum]|uniref:protein tantalus n=1 Tax=Copidosoma floridanum TaxID=29053 RepID=UPI0006C9575C|nr:protein tantalus [Copidosoma floridanum]
MDGGSTIRINVNNTAQEVNLPDVVDSLQKLAVDMPEQDVIPTLGQRRSLRKRKPRDLDDINLNRRCSLRPRKRSYEEMETEDQIKGYYLDKTIKKHTNSLETIFEEQEDLTPPPNHMSSKRFKRMIQFTTEPTRSKIKKRKEKVKKIFGSKLNFKKRKYVSMNTLLNKLNGLQKDVSVQNPQEV